MASRGTVPRTVRPSGLRCSECGWTTVKWVGRCGECQTWGSVAEVAAVPARRTTAGPAVTAAQRIGEVDLDRSVWEPTGVGEFDRVLGGGLVPGSVVLVAGEPGIGKSTLVLDVAARAARAGRAVLYVTGEESVAQIRMRAERIEAMAASLYLAAETDLASVLGQIEAVDPAVVVIDSVQTIASAEVDGAAGNVTQVREVAASLIHVAKTRGIAVLLVGHVTKDGSIAGPRLLEHLVDVVIGFEGERHSRLRLVRAVKNRYGPTDEVGCFDLSDVGIVGLADPSGLFLSTRDQLVPGTCVTVTLEGRRPLVAEIQALVAASSGPAPRRVTHGLDPSRVAMVAAVLERRARAPLGSSDSYVSTVGGVRVTEPAADLAVALAMASAMVDRPLAPRAIAIGEVGLAGEIRPVSAVPRRLSEAARLGFTTAFVPPGVIGSGPLPESLRVIEVAQLVEAVGAALTRPVALTG
ncbi:MAG TPA: DNA repair protein RadA [Candidatus Lustribacter sp.]|nr:DNA repair protein RadA [Candidatus Lustribacter sp.]